MQFQKALVCFTVDNVQSDAGGVQVGGLTSVVAGVGLDDVLDGEDAHRGVLGDDLESRRETFGRANHLSIVVPAKSS